MRILIFSAYYWPEVSGTAPYVTAPAEHLAGEGHDVRVVASYPHYPQWEALEGRRLGTTVRHNGVTVYRRWHTIPQTQTAKSRALYEGSLLALGLTALPVAWRPDTILGVSPALASATLAASASAVYRRPFGLIFHDLMGKGASQTGISGNSRIADTLERIELGLGRRADRLLVLTDGFKRFFEQGGVPSHRLDVAPTWTLRPAATVEQAAARAAAGWTDDQFICMHGGNMGQKQGLDNVIDAAQLLAQRDNTRIAIVLVGDGNDRRRLQQRAAEAQLANVTFLPMQKPEDFDQMLVGADALLLNQRASVADMSLPSKLSAYFAAGRPVIAAASADSVAAGEVVHADGGIVTDPTSPMDLVKALEHLESHPEAREQLGQNARNYARSCLSSDVILPKYSAFAAAVASARRGA